MTALIARSVSSDPTWTDFFCGAGGASSGLVEAGFRVVTAANHWDRAIETHAANHPGTEHLCADINNLDMRRIPSTTCLWASVICTEISPAGGKRRTRTKGQMKLLEYGSVSDAAYERTRATALDVIRAAEVHRFDVVVVENVVDFVTDWELFDWWRQGMHILGYQSRVVSASSAHIGGEGNDPAPQWRNRIYIVFVRNGVPMPDLEPRPLAWCETCGADVEARQAWRNGNTVGEYRQQYDYRCPNSACRHALVEPYIRPASSVIDWSRPGTRIGDRSKPLAESTMRKIRNGLEMYVNEPVLITSAHGSEHDGRPQPAARVPLATRTVKIGDGIAVPGAFITELRGGGSKHRPVTHPLATITASGNHHGLVIPYRRGTAKPASEPMLTLATRDSAGLVQHGQAPVAIEDCHYRMVSPREQMSAQRFDPGYVVLGNQAEQTMQAGNAVSVNVARWIGERVGAALGGAKRAAA